MKTQNTFIALALFFISFNAFSQQIGTGFAPLSIPDFSAPLKSGLYDGLSPLGTTPDLSHPWQHLFVARHQNQLNNYQLQLASSFAINDRLFFRKMIDVGLGVSNTTWVELATRGANSFIGDQNVKGHEYVDGYITCKLATNEGGAIGIENPLKTATNSANLWRIYNMTGQYGNSLQFWNYGVNGFAGGHRLTILDGGNVGIGIQAPTEKLEIAGNTKVSGNLSIGKDTEIATISGPTNSGSIQIKSHSALGGSTNRYLRLGWKDGLNNFAPALSINDDLNVGIGTTTPSLKMVVAQDITSNADVDVAQFGIMGSTDNRKRLVMGYDTNGDGFGFIKSGFYGVKWTNLSLQPTGGNVGIGTTTPKAKLEVVGGHTDSRIVLHSEGNLTDTSRADLSLWASEPGIAWTGVGIGNNIHNYKTTAGGLTLINTARGGSYMRLLDNAINFNTVSNTGVDTQVMRLDEKGNVGIGTNSPDEKLTVKGQIHALEVRIDKAGALVPDYVFANDYKLKTLSEVDSYIKANNHLPEIPSANEIEKNGLILGEMNLSLLKKVEELTLYAIEQQKKLEAQNSAMVEQKKAMEVQAKTMELLSARLTSLEKK
jgi:Phage T4 tail fibre